MKILQKKYFIPITLIIIFVFANSCITLRKKDSKVLKLFKKEGQVPQIYHETYKNDEIRFIAYKPIKKQLPTILFVHGAPWIFCRFL